MNVWILIVGLKWFSNGSKWPWIVFDACNSYFWYIKILVWVWWRDFFFYRSKIFRLSILGFEGYRWWTSVTLRWSTENHFGAKSIAANRSWPRGHSGPRQTAATFKSVHFHFLFELLELIIIDGFFTFLRLILKLSFSTNHSSLQIFPGQKFYDFELNIKYLVLISADWFLSSRRLYDISV